MLSAVRSRILSRRAPGYDFPIGSVQRKGDSDHLAVLARDLEAIGGLGRIVIAHGGTL